MELNTFNELSKEELASIDGGIWGIVAGVVVSVGLWTISEWDCLVEGYESVRNN